MIFVLIISQNKKKHGGEEQGIFAIMIGRKGKDSGVKCGREQLVYEEALVILWFRARVGDIAKDV